MRRIRPLLIAVAVGALGVVMLPSVAHAEPKGHAEEECIVLLEEGKSIDDCQEAPSPILPAGNEIIWGAIAFGILFLAMLKFGLPAVRKTMAAREDRIRSDLERAERPAPRPRPSWRSTAAARRGPHRGDAHPRGGASVGRGGQAPDPVTGRDRGRRDPVPGAGRHPARGRSRHGRCAGTRRRPRDRAGREDRRAQPRP